MRIAQREPTAPRLNTPSALVDRLRRSRMASAALGLLGSSWVLGGIIVLLSWRPVFVAPTVGLDPSWHLALEMAAVDRLHWGTELVFNYGPLGFLRAPLVAFTWPAVLSAVYLLALRLALATSVIWVARRRFDLPIALVMAFVILCVSHSDLAVPLAFIWCAAALVEDPPPLLARRVVLFGGGALSGLELLVKLNEGLLIAGMCAVAALTMGVRRSRDLASFGVVFLASLITLWFATGQGVSNADDFIVGSFQLLRGYSSALQHAGAPWAAAAALLTWALALVAAWLTGRDLPAPRRAGLLLLVLALGFVGWKEGFVRQDAGHMVIFFSWMLAPWVALRWPGRRGLPLAAGFVMVAGLYFATTGLRPRDQFGPVENARTAVRNLRTVFDPARRSATRDSSRFAMRFRYALDLPSLALVQGKTVDAWPWETGLIWAYGLDWKPVPTSRSTAAYTPWLDELNARALASPTGPERILRHATGPVPTSGPVAPNEASLHSIDGRYGPYDSPAAARAMLCNFEALRTTDRYQVLGRVPNRCGPPRLLRSTAASYGQQVGIPRPPTGHDVVFVRIHGAAPAGIEAVRTFLFRAPARYVVFNGSASYRLVANVAGDGLILDAPAGSDFPKPFALAPGARTVGVRKDSGLLSPGGELHFDFYGMRVRPE